MRVTAMALLLMAVGTATPDEVRRTAGEILSDPSLQTELPGREDFELPNLDLDLQPFRIVAIVVAVLVGIYLLVWIIREWRRYSRDEKSKDDGESAHDSETKNRQKRRRQGLERAKRRAAAGDFAGAIHLLLELAVDELEERREFRPEDSLTSREILVRAPLVEDARSELGRLVSAVELSHFGERPVEAPDYDRCEAHYTRFIDLCEQGAG